MMSSEQVAQIADLLSGRKVSDGQGKINGAAAPLATVTRGRGRGTAGAADTSVGGTDTGRLSGADKLSASARDSGSGAGRRGTGGNRDFSSPDESEGDPGTEADDIDQVDGDQADQADQVDQDGQDGAEDPPYTLKELAAKLDVPLKTLYELDIPMGEGKSLSLGDLKDLARESESNASALKTLRDDLEDREADILTRRHQVSQILDALGGQVPPYVAQQMQEQQARHMEREREALRAAIPSWSNPGAWEADKARMVEFIGRYGFGTRDLESVTDHRFLKMVRDISNGWAATRKSPTKPGESPSGNRTAPGPRRAASSETLRATMSRAQRPDATKADKLAGIDALLRTH